MEKLEKTNILNEYFSIYKNLLTEKQVLYFTYYYEEDYSLQEIADLFNVSRNAIYDSLKKTEELLFNFEEKLNLVDRKNLRKKLINSYLEDNNKEHLLDLKRMDE